MVAEPRTWVDVEGAVREWARDNVDEVSRRVFFGYNEAAALPQIVLFRIGGPDDRCLIQFDVWGKPKAQAASVAAKLATAADELSRYVTEGVILHGSVVESVRWQPDEERDTRRYVGDVMSTATARAWHSSIWPR